MAIENILQVDVPVPEAHFSLEGIDGVGKSTQFIRIEKKLILNNISLQTGKSPSSTPLGEFLRSNMGNLKTWERNSLFLMDMIGILKDNEGSGKVLLWDRYKDSNRIANKDMTILEAEKSVAILPETTRTFLLDIDPEIIIASRKESLHGHSLDLDWQREKRQRYLSLAERANPRIIVVDATAKIDSITEFISQSIIKDLRDLGLFNK